MGHRTQIEIEIESYPNPVALKWDEQDLALLHRYEKMLIDSARGMSLEIAPPHIPVIATEEGYQFSPEGARYDLDQLT